MDYGTMTQKHTKAMNKFEGIFFAFSNEQMNKALEKLGVSKKDICSIGGGGYLLKEKKEAFYEMLTENEKELKEAFKKKEFAYSAFRYELFNHEYGITMDIEDTLEALGITFQELKENKMWLGQMTKAESYVIKNTY